MPLRLTGLVVLFVGLLLGVRAVAQEAEGDAAAAERETARIEPYTGPPIFLPEGEPPVPATVAEERAVTDYYDQETKQKPKMEREVTIYSDGGIVNSGFYREYFENGEKFVEGQFDKGDPTGEWTYYHDSGEIAKKVTYVNGVPDGPVVLKRADGSLAFEREYKAGKRNGTWKAYDPTGKIVVGEERYVDGVPDGLWQSWFPDGKQKQQNNFKQGKLDGTSIEWDKDGVKRAEITFVDGKRDGTARVWTADGKVVEQVYEDDKLISTKRE